MCIVMKLNINCFYFSLHVSLVCDGYQQCEDGSDEDYANCSNCTRNVVFI